MATKYQNVVTKYQSHVRSLALQDLEGGGSYQTVTIVPSDTNPGELSYVLFVSEAGDGTSNILDENGAMSMFDLNDAAQIGESFLTKQVESHHKMKTIRLATRRSQLVTQQHVCAYCSYTSPKRYVLINLCLFL